jgi:hypothetical protein
VEVTCLQNNGTVLCMMHMFSHILSHCAKFFVRCRTTCRRCTFTNQFTYVRIYVHIYIFMRRPRLLLDFRYILGLFNTFLQCDVKFYKWHVPATKLFGLFLSETCSFFFKFCRRQIYRVSLIMHFKSECQSLKRNVQNKMIKYKLNYQMFKFCYF